MVEKTKKQKVKPLIKILDNYILKQRKKRNKQLIEDPNYENIINFRTIIFSLGLLLAVFVPFFGLQSSNENIIRALLVIIGLVIAIFNIKKNEINSFLIAVTAIMLLSTPLIGFINFYVLKYITIISAENIKNIFSNIFIILVPAAIYVAFKSLFITSVD